MTKSKLFHRVGKKLNLPSTSALFIIYQSKVMYIKGKHLFYLLILVKKIQISPNKQRFSYCQKCLFKTLRFHHVLWQALSTQHQIKGFVTLLYFTGNFGNFSLKLELLHHPNWRSFSRVNI